MSNFRTPPLPSPEERKPANEAAERAAREDREFHDRLRKRRDEGMTTETFRLSTVEPEKGKKKRKVNPHRPSQPFE